MNLKTRLSKLEKTKRRMVTEAECICFPPEEPPHLELRPEIEAAKTVLCPLHGERFSSVAEHIYRVIDLPVHLDPSWRNRRSPQYIKAMEASFPSDRWPATKIVEPDGAVRSVLKDGAEIHRLDPPEEILEYKPLPDWERPS
jgi:hypothetical protein